MFAHPQTYVFPPPAAFEMLAEGIAADRLELWFLPGRGRALGIRSQAGDARLLPARAANALTIGLGGRQVEPLEVSVLPHLEPIDLVKVVARDRSGRALYVLVPDPGGKAFQACPPEDPDFEAKASDLDAGAYQEALEKELEKLAAKGDARIGARRFFAALDLQTNEQLLPVLVERGQLFQEDATQRRLEMNALAIELRQRLPERGRRYAPGAPPPVLTDLCWDGFRSRLESFSEIFTGLITTHLGSPLAVAQAFCQFANGDLRLPLPNLAVATQPSSGWFFLFSEFALMARDHGVQPADWSEWGRAMLCSQELFVNTYGPSAPAGADFYSYSPAQFGGNGRVPLDAPAVATVATGANALDPDLVASRDAREYLPGLL